MYSSFFKSFSIITLALILISIFTLKYTNITTSDTTQPFNPNKFNWPLPGNKNITSPFGPRKSPTGGASSYHSGLDIAATEGTPIYVCFPGKITFTRLQRRRRIHNNRPKRKHHSLILSHLPKLSLHSRSISHLKLNHRPRRTKIRNKHHWKPIQRLHRQTHKRRDNRLPPTLNNKKRRQSRQSIKLFLILWFIS